MARKSSSGNKNDVKTTIIIVLLAIVGIQIFLSFNKKNASLKQKTTIKTAGVVKSAKTNKPVVVRPQPIPKKHLKGSGGKIAFVLDDWGYSTHNCKYLKSIKSALAIAILPNLKHTDEIIKCASINGKDMMLHLPLEPYSNKDRYPDNYLITTQMKPSEVTRILLDALNKMPQVYGVNNHMGSKATENIELMQIIFKQLKKRKLFFIDSMTSPHHSICGELADQMNLPFAQRDVFLDNINSKEEIRKQILVLVQKARKNGFAIAIGHDRELTLQVIQEQIPLLQEQGFEIVSVKELLRNQ